MSVISVPTTLAAVGSSKTTSLLNPLNNSINQVTSWTTNALSGVDGSLKNEYSKFGTNVESDYKQYISNNLNILKDNVPKAQEYPKLLKENAEEINYYLFTLGTLVQEVVKSVPNIIRDSVLAVIPGKENQQLLSVQKMILMGMSSSLSEFFEGIKSAMQNHSSLISQLSTKDAKGVIQIFRELSLTKIEQFLKEVKSNSSTLETESSKYCNTTKLMLHLLVGKNKIEGMKQQITQLNSTLETMESELKAIDGLEAVLTKVKSQLNELSKNQLIQDPCTSSSKQ